MQQLILLSWHIFTKLVSMDFYLIQYGCYTYGHALYDTVYYLRQYISSDKVNSSALLQFVLLLFQSL